MLDPASRVPLYYQLETEIRQLMEKGAWKPNETIPPERVLIERYGVSRITVRQALANLVAEGLLYRRHGKGTYVSNPPAMVMSETLSELTGHLEELQLRGLNPRVRVLTLEIRRLPAEVALALQRENGVAGWYVYRIVTVERQPLMLSACWLPVDLGINLTREMLKQYGLATLLSAHGHPPVKGIQQIGAASAGPEEAVLLGIRDGEAVLRVCRKIVGGGDVPLIWFHTLYRADRYEYEVELKRRRA